MKKITNDYVFHRDFNKQYPIITHANGVYLFDEIGKRYLDASSGAVSVNLGHGVTEITQEIYKQAQQVAFVHTVRFETPVLQKLSYEIAKLTPATLNRTFFASGGSEANESAIKFAHQYHFDRGDFKKNLVLGSWNSYHGNTLGALSAGGDEKRRDIYSSILNEFPHIQTPEFNDETEKVLKDIEVVKQTISDIGKEHISALIIEPISGSQKGAMPLPEIYLKGLREICDEYNIILIVDEVMTGFGRTGENFAIDHYNLVPDILTFGKGISGGYAPLSGMVVHDRLVDSLLEYGEGTFKHGLTFSGHPVSVAAGYAALQFYTQNYILENCRTQSKYLIEKLQELMSMHKSIKEIRGKGLLIGLELGYNRNDNNYFTSDYSPSTHLNKLAIGNGAVFYPGSRNTRDERHSEHLIIAPPLTIKSNEIDELIEILHISLLEFAEQNSEYDENS